MSKETLTGPRLRFFGYYPGTVAVVTAAHAGTRNVLSVGWHAALSIRPPMYGVAVGGARASNPLIRGSGAFCVNFLPFEHAEAIAGAGTLSLHDGVDKFARLGLSTRPAAHIGAPVLEAAYLSYECEVRAVHTTGDHDWFVGEVLAVHYDEAAFENGLLDTAHTPAALYYGRASYGAFGGETRAVFPPETFRDAE